MIQGVPVQTEVRRGFVHMVRSYLRDTPELNRLVSGEESGDRQIGLAIDLAVADFNGTPPMTGFPLEYLLYKNQHQLLLHMAVIVILESISILQTRNQLSYSAGGINVAVNDKTPLIMGFIQYLQASTEQKKQRVKIAMNIESIMSPGDYGVFSEYSYINHG